MPESNKPLRKRKPPAATGESGQLRSFDTVFEDLREPLQRHLFVLTGNPAAAEDLTQEAFLRLNQELRLGRDVQSVKAWLFRTGHNLAIDHHRRGMRSSEQRLEADMSQIADSAQSALDLVWEHERARLIRAAMHRLSRQQRRCLRLRAEGLRYKDIADILDITEGSVCEHIRRGLNQLRAELKIIDPL